MSTISITPVSVPTLASTPASPSSSHSQHSNSPTNSILGSPVDPIAYPTPAVSPSATYDLAPRLRKRRSSLSVQYTHGQLKPSGVKAGVGARSRSGSVSNECEGEVKSISLTSRLRSRSVGVGLRDRRIRAGPAPPPPTAPLPPIPTTFVQPPVPIPSTTRRTHAPHHSVADHVLLSPYCDVFPSSSANSNNNCYFNPMSSVNEVALMNGAGRSESFSSSNLSASPVNACTLSPDFADKVVYAMGAVSPRLSVQDGQHEFGMDLGLGVGMNSNSSPSMELGWAGNDVEMMDV